MARKKGNRKGGNKKTFGARNDSNAQRNWVELVRENEKWENYYKSLNIIPEDEWDAFKLTCQSQLPLTFRITGSKDYAHEILALFKNDHLPNLMNITEWEGKAISPPKVLPWYPDGLAWQLDVSKGIIRKNEQFAKTQKFLVVENAVGNISRQEAVSMIPPIVLEVQPHHTVLDMCAAPGSKTAQLIEALHSKNNEPSGFVLANDADYKRSHMLVHQLKRLNSPNLMVVNHDAQFFPRIKLNANMKEFLKFDRILCDVPCSGDGTMRKNVNVWKDWNTGSGLGLHTVQLNILNRGLSLLKNGGRLVYSTCSLNPIENEAVVAAALRKWGNQVMLVNCDDKLPGLVRAKGINQWSVYDKYYQVKIKGDEGCCDTWFPPSKEEIDDFHLENCIRVYPHQQNTGGFFITVFEKISGEPSGEHPQEPEQKKVKIDSASSSLVRKEKLPRDANEEPFVFIDPTHPKLQDCWNFYGIDSTFDKSTCLVRNSTGEPSRIIYHVSTSLKNILKENEDRLKMVYCGIKLFVSQRSDIQCSWRIQNEALPVIKNHMNNNRVVKTNLNLFKILLLEAFPKFEDFEKDHIDDNFITSMKALSPGCAFIEVDREDEKESLFLPIWNGSKCVNLMVCKENTHELLYRIFGIETAHSPILKPDSTLDTISTESSNEEPLISREDVAL